MASEKRFDSVNEFRNTLADQQRTLMPRAESEVRINALTEKVDSAITIAKELMAGSAGNSAGLSAGWGYAVGAIGTALAILSMLFKK